MAGKRGWKNSSIFPLFLIAAGLLLLLLGAGSETAQTAPDPGFIHGHADFKVYINGRPLNFSDPAFDVRSPYIHLHTGNFDGGEVLHIEAEGVPLSHFFLSIRMGLSDKCLTVSNTSFCTSGNRRLRMFVNGREESDVGAYVPRDLDRILVTYGPVNAKETERQMESVTDYACIHSEKCPERGPESEYGGVEAF